MSKLVLKVKKSVLFELMPQCGMLSKGGKMPVGSIRTWGGKEYIKVASGDWMLKDMANKEKRPSNLKDHIHTLLHGTDEDKAKLVKRHFFLANTPQFIKDIGLKGEFFSVRYGVITRHIGKDANHDLSVQNWVDLCDKIKEPFAITRYNNEGYRLFTEVKINGNFIAVGVDVKNAGKNIQVNSVVTAFGYKEKPVTGEILYISPKINLDQEAVLRKLNSSQYPT